MILRWVGSSGVTVHALADLPELRQQDNGFVWLDVPEWNDGAERLLTEEFGFHHLAVQAARERNHTPRLHVYPDHVFMVIHAPEIGEHGHVHYLELDQFIGREYLVTVHGPVNPVVPLDAAMQETRQIVTRMEAGRLQPSSPFDLTYALVSAIVRRESSLVAELARQVGQLEQRVMVASDQDGPQEFLTALFTARHELLTVHTMASQSGEIYERAITLAGRFAPEESILLMKDLLDQYLRVAHISQSQLEFLMGVTEFYRARTDTKMTIAAERLAVIAAVTLPVTALSSVVGMNVIVNDTTRWLPLAVLLLAMITLSLTLMHWAKRQGWW
ncbi:MAG TPA: magnesium transporter CorA family protein [Microlunatus sp.]